jgi:hypothetical protein
VAEGRGKEGLAVPLSDYERRRLRELEADLAADDPALARKLAAGMSSRRRLRWSVGMVVALAGFGLMILGYSAQIASLGALGLLLMLGGTLGHGWRWVLDQGGPG